MACRSLRAMRKRWAASLGPFIQDDAFTHRTPHDVVEGVTPVVELVRTIKQEVLSYGKIAQRGSDALKLPPAGAVNSISFRLDDEQVGVRIRPGGAAGP